MSIKDVIFVMCGLLAVVGMVLAAYAQGYRDAEKKAITHSRSFIEQAIEDHPKEAMEKLQERKSSIEISP